MAISRRTFSKLTLAAFGAGALGSTAVAGNLPAPFDNPGRSESRWFATFRPAISLRPIWRRGRSGGGTGRQLAGVRQPAGRHAKPKWSTRPSRLVSTASSYSTA